MQILREGEKMGLNEAQKKAVETIGRNVSVNAGAGSGKTKVLTERYVYILENGDLEEGKEIEPILAITSTKKAAGEMKERIRGLIKERFSQGEKWRRLYRDLERGSISTIHGLCSKMLRENPVEAAVDPSFEILDEEGQDRLLYETVYGYLIENVEKDDRVYRFISEFNVYNINEIAEILIKIYNEVRNAGMTFKDLREITLRNIDEISLDKNLIEKIKDDFLYLIEKGRANSKYAKLKNDEVWNNFKSSRENENIADALIYLKEFIGNMKGEEERIERLKDNVDKAVMIKEKDRRWLYEIVLDCLIDIDNRYSGRKKEEGVLDYEDLQIEALNLLNKETILRKYQNKYKYIMVDEFQDVNELQKNIIYKLATEKSDLDRQNLFIVGDPKQSIYGFRGADVQVFYDAMEDIKRVSEIEPIVLKENYRTVNTILKFINEMFKNIMGDKYNELNFTHISENQVDVEILECEDLEIPLGESDSYYNKVYESRIISKRIKELVKSGKYTYGDFAVLFRSTTDDYIYEEALREYGIPYYNLGGKGFFKQKEIIDLMNCIKGISNPFDNISLTGVLRSPMFGLSDESIYWLLRQGKKSILDAMKDGLNNISFDEREKINYAYSTLSSFIRKKNLVQLNLLVEDIVKSTYYAEGLKFLRGGEQRVGNIYKFIEMSRKFYEKEEGTLEDFIDYIDYLKERGMDESQAQIRSQEENEVKLLTIHKSKGLEFKVVVIPQLAKKFMEDSSKILFDKRYGIGIKDEEVSPFYDHLKKVERKKEEEENKRILYVALTRGEKKLILGMQGKNEGFKRFLSEFLNLVQYDKYGSVETNDENQNEEEVIEKKSLNQDNIYISPQDSDKRVFNYYSVSQYLSFRECKRKFYMSYYRKLPLNNRNFNINSGNGHIISPTLRGEIVHKFCELYSKNKDIDELIGNIAEYYGVGMSKNVFNELYPYIDNYLKYYNEEYDKIYREKRFYYNMENNFIYGIIDRINIIGGKGEIWDFKTNRTEDKISLIDRYRPQLQLYAKALHDIYNIEVIRAKLFLLESGEFEDIDVSENALKENMGKIKDFIHFVSGNDEIEKYSRNKDCYQHCNFYRICNR